MERRYYVSFACGEHVQSLRPLNKMLTLIASPGTSDFIQQQMFAMNNMQAEREAQEREAQKRKLQRPKQQAEPPVPPLPPRV